MEINFYFSKEVKSRLTWEDRDTLEAMFEGEISSRGLRNLAARFMVDKENKYLDFKVAKRELGKLNDEESAVVLKKFMEALKDAAIPKGTGTSLEPPLEVIPSSESPIGSEPLTPQKIGESLPGT